VVATLPDEWQSRGRPRAVVHPHRSNRIEGEQLAAVTVYMTAWIGRRHDLLLENLSRPHYESGDAEVEQFLRLIAQRIRFEGECRLKYVSVSRSRRGAGQSGILFAAAATILCAAVLNELRAARDYYDNKAAVYSATSGAERTSGLYSGDFAATTRFCPMRSVFRTTWILPRVMSASRTHWPSRVGSLTDLEHFGGAL